MNFYALLPLAAFITNIFLGCYILYRDSKQKQNILYSLITFALATWAIGDFLTFTSTTPEAALTFGKIGTYGSSLTAVFILHFFLVFSKKEFISKKIFNILLYFPALFFIIVAFTTNLISKSATVEYWGYTATAGTLYLLLTLYVVGYIIIGILFCYRFYLKSAVADEKIQAKLLIFGISIPLIGGIITQVIPDALGFNLIPLSTTLTTVMVLIIAYAIIKYRLMTPLVFSIQRKLIAGFLIVAGLFVIIGYVAKTSGIILLPIIALGFSIIICLTLFILISKSISKPIIQLTNATSEISKGNMDIKIDVTSNDEIGILASALGHMAKDLKNYHENLESMVEEKTKELNTKLRELEDYKKVTVDRELKMIELKKEMEELKNKTNGGEIH